MRLSLSHQLTLFLAVCIFLTASAAIVPAYLLVRQELVTQLDCRLSEALTNSRIVLDLPLADSKSRTRLTFCSFV